MTTIKVDKITPGSGTTTTLGDSGDTFTIPAGVTFANSGSTNLGDQISYCSTTKSASFTAVANKGYFINTSDASPFLNYAVTVASGTLYSVGGTGNAYFLDASRNMSLTLLKGRTYRFTQSDNSNDNHPLIISTSNSTTLSTFLAGIVSSGITYNLDGASNQTNYTNTTTFNAATTRYIEFQPQTTGTFYFGCYVHGVQMGGAITSEELTVTLPSSPTVGTEMIIIDSTGDASTNNIVVGRGGSKIKGLCNNAILKTSRVGVRLIYSDASQGWVTITSANETAPALDQTLYVTATGGTETTSGDYKIHTFNSDANFVVSCAGNSSGSNTVDYLVVAGGGGGASGAGGAGGGGAGGYRFSNGTASGCYSAGPSPLGATGLSVTAQTYPISVGAGGRAGSNSPSPGYDGGTGTNSIFSTITSAGGGGGRESPTRTNGNGGSGGGGSYQTTCGGSGNNPPVSPPQGNDGGTAAIPGAYNTSGGGGGGAGAVGGPGPTGTSCRAGAGGAGLANSITASPVTRASGGNGHGQNPGGNVTNPTPTPGGGGASGSNGTANTGGGGGSNAPGGGTGGSGVVIIRYKYQN